MVFCKIFLISLGTAGKKRTVNALPKLGSALFLVDFEI